MLCSVGWLAPDDLPPMLRSRLRLARLGRLPGWRCLSSLPWESDLRTVWEVVETHARNGRRQGTTPTPDSLRVSWSTLGRLAREPNERQRLQNAPKVLSPLAADTEMALPDFDAHALATTVSGVANLHVAGWRASGGLWAGLAKHCTRSVATMSAHEVASTVLGFAKVGRRPSPLFDAIADEAAARLGEFTPEDLANTAWAFAAADRPAPALFGGDAFVSRSAAEAEDGFEPEALRQLHQWQLWQEERGAAWPALPPELAQRCRAAFCEAEGGVKSELQADVAASLRALGLAHKQRERTPQGYS